MPTPNHWMKTTGKTVFRILWFGLVFIILLSRAVSAGVSHDEYQFVAGAQLFAEEGFLPYVDFPFLHMPYMPIIYGLFLSFGAHDLFIARLVNELFIFFSVILLFSFAMRFFRKSNAIVQLSVGALAVFLCVMNPSLAYMDGRAFNHGAPVFLSLATIWAYSRISENKPRGIWVFVCGLLIGIAAGTRLSYAVLIFPILFAILLDPAFRNHKEQLRTLLAFSLGLFLALLPAGILFLLAPKPFIYGNLHYIALNTVYRKNLGYPFSMDLPGKLYYFFQQISADPGNILLYLALASFGIAACLAWFRTKEREYFGIVFVYLSGTVLLLSALSPTPLWPQYFFAPIPFLITGLFWGLAKLFIHRKKALIASITILVAAIACTQPVQEIVPRLHRLVLRENWTTDQIHQLGETIRSQIPCEQNCKVLTLEPILPLEAGLETYPMFTVGSFSWRTAPILSKERRTEYQIISPEDLPEFLSGDPPAAILSGLEADNDGFTPYDPGGLEQPFIDYAIKNHYRSMQIPMSFDGKQVVSITLWLR